MNTHIILKVDFRRKSYWENDQKSVVFLMLGSPIPNIMPRSAVRIDGSSTIRMLRIAESGTSENNKTVRKAINAMAKKI
jgi:hypothetical protein